MKPETVLTMHCDAVTVSCFSVFRGFSGKAGETPNMWLTSRSGRLAGNNHWAHFFGSNVQLSDKQDEATLRVHSSAPSPSLPACTGVALVSQFWCYIREHGCERRRQGHRGVCVMQHETDCRITCVGRSLQERGDGGEVEKREEMGV